MKKIISVLSSILTFIFFCSLYCAGAVSFDLPFEIASDSAVLINLDRDDIIFEKNPDAEQMPASLVNIMTAVIVLENCNTPDKTTITADRELYAEFDEYEYPDDLRYGQIWDGDVMTVNDYLYAMMLVSSCEAANILAYHFGNNSISAFVDMMNAKAKEIGAENTVFANPHGLYDPKQVTTAHDMALITKYALGVPGFEKIATTEDYYVKPQSVVTEHEEPWIWSHSNIIMSSASNHYLLGVKGIKTGNLQLTGRNIVTMGVYNGIRYLLVLLNAPFYDEEGDSKYYHILDAYDVMKWVFDNFEYKDLLSTKEEIAEIKVDNSDGDGYVLLMPEKNCKELWYNDVDVTSIQRTVRLYEDVNAPIKKGQKLGEVELKLSGELIANVDLVADRDINRSFVKFNLTTARDFFKSVWYKRAIIISSSLSVLYLLICIWAYVYMRRHPKTGFANKRIVKKLYGNKKK